LDLEEFNEWMNEEDYLYDDEVCIWREIQKCQVSKFSYKKKY